MSKAVLRVGLLLLLPVSLFAQDYGASRVPTPKAEVATGYSYTRIEGSDLHGWNFEVAGNANRNLGIVGDFSGQYNSEKFTLGTASSSSNLTLTSVMGGIRASEREMKWFTPSVDALFGFTRINADVTTAQPGVPNVTASNDVTGFSMVIGGALDVNMSRRVAVRLFQADYLVIRADGFKHEGARVSAGLVFRLGERND